MKKKPVIIERTKTHLRAIPFRFNVVTGNAEQPRSYLFESNNFEAQNEEMDLFIKEFFFDNNGIFINLPFEELILREISLPFVARGKVRELLPYELESQLPYEISEIFYDYHAYPDEKNGRTNIIVAACRKNFLENYIQFFLKNNHELKGVYVPPDSLLQLSSYVEEETTCILYMSGNYSIYLISRQGTWLYSRIVPQGYDRLFSDISNKWNKDSEESKKILMEISLMDSEIVDSDYYKQKFKLSKIKSKELVDSILKFSSSTNQELKSTIARYNQDGSAFNNLVLMSDLENQVFLENILSQKISLNINTFPYGHTPVSLMGRSYVILAGMINAISSNRFLNLLDSQIKKLFKKKKDHGNYLVMGILIISAVFFLSSFVINVIQKKKLYSIAEAKKKELFTGLFNKNPESQISLVTQAAQLVEEQKKRSEIYKLQSNKMKLGHILVELNKALIRSGSLQVERFVYSNNMVTILGTAEDFNELNNIKNLVIGTKIFAEAEMKDQRSYLGADGRNRVRFILNIKPRIQEEIHDGR